ncbi:unnamed protein product [Symbiodinium natans]|uniref:Alpha 1,4-glycosyltransferase domain-containing protein n=1 Tax=Symbiodinium natans TaxID=878477 RepID=A0A812U2Y8_9DINO|nr:unnamed protein product [Symbiodinium natans]
MHKAAKAAVRFLAAPENAKAKWLQSLYETTSEPEGFLPLQDQKVEAVLLAVLQDTGIQRPRETFLVCELLARGFRSGGAPSPRRAAESQAEKPLDLLSTTAACRASEVRALLKLLQPTGPEDAAGDSKGAEESADVGVGRISPAEVRISARKALLTLACAHRGAFSATLLEFLQDPGAIPELLAVGTAAGEEGQRLVVELLVRGFDSPVVQCFADSALAGDRKRLLNQLFMSRDAFVRVTVGILLAALLCHEGYGEAAQAEAGIAAVSEELETLSPAQPLESELADLQRVLAEEDCWLWLCRLAAVRRWPAASNFALLVMLRLVQPSPEKLTETAGKFKPHFAQHVQDGADLDSLALLAQRPLPKASKSQTTRKAGKQGIKIPPNVLFNYKFNVLKATKQQLQENPLLGVMQLNVKHTVGLFGSNVSHVHFWDDDQCISELKQLKQFGGEELAEGFQSLRHGKYKSDLCRLAQLWKYGGYYFDTDILPVKSMRDYLDPDTTFASVRGMYSKEIFQAFLAATPKNKLIGENLKSFGKWLKERPRSQEPANIGPKLMWKSMRKTGGRFKKAPEFVTGSEKIQLFQEHRIAYWRSGKEPIEGLLTGHSKWGDCNIAVVDQDTDEVVMYPRVISHNDDTCSEQKKLIVQHFLVES